MYGDQSRAHRRGASHCPADGVGNVVEFQIEKDVRSSGPNLPHDRRTARRKELAADFVEATLITQLLDEGERGAGVCHVERNDRDRTHDVLNSREPTMSPSERTLWRAHQASSSLTMRAGARGSRMAAVPTPTSEAPAMRYCSAWFADVTPPIPMIGAR